TKALDKAVVDQGLVRDRIFQLDRKLKALDTAAGSDDAASAMGLTKEKAIEQKAALEKELAALGTNFDKLGDEIKRLSDLQAKLKPQLDPTHVKEVQKKLELHDGVINDAKQHLESQKAAGDVAGAGR